MKNIYSKREVEFNPPKYSTTENIFFNFYIPHNKYPAYGQVAVTQCGVHLEWRVVGIKSDYEYIGKDTEENYYKALRKAKRLFEGKSKEIEELNT